MRLLLLSDLHGKIPEIREGECFDLVLCAGDIGDDTLLRDLFFKRIRIHGDGLDKNSYEKIIVDHYVSMGRSYERIVHKLRGLGKYLILVPGNQDVLFNKYHKGLMDVVRDVPGVEMLHFSKVDLTLFSVVGYGFNMEPEIPIYELNSVPKRFHRYFKQFLLKQVRIFERLFTEAKFPVIFLTHNMPFGVLDKVKAEWSGAYGLNYGSLVAKNVVRKLKPVLVHGGHMHEYHDLEIVDGVICINSGYGREGRYCIVETSGSCIKKVEFYEGKVKLRETVFS